ncbi:hypothetical protein R6Z07F_020283 [Ovis aries]
MSRIAKRNRATKMALVTGETRAYMVPPKGRHRVLKEGQRRERCGLPPAPVERRPDREESSSGQHPQGACSLGAKGVPGLVETPGPLDPQPEPPSLWCSREALPLAVVLAQLMPTGHHSFRLLLEESTFQALRKLWTIVNSHCFVSIWWAEDSTCVGVSEEHFENILERVGSDKVEGRLVALGVPPEPSTMQPQDGLSPCPEGAQETTGHPELAPTTPLAGTYAALGAGPGQKPQTP